MSKAPPSTHPPTQFLFTQWITSDHTRKTKDGKFIFLWSAHFNGAIIHWHRLQRFLNQRFQAPLIAINCSGNIPVRVRYCHIIIREELLMFSQHIIPIKCVISSCCIAHYIGINNNAQLISTCCHLNQMKPQCHTDIIWRQILRQRSGGGAVLSTAWLNGEQDSAVNYKAVPKNYGEHQKTN